MASLPPQAITHLAVLQGSAGCAGRSCPPAHVVLRTQSRPPGLPRQLRGASNIIVRSTPLSGCCTFT